MSDQKETPFYVQYLPVPEGLRSFFAIVGVVFILGTVIISYAIASTQIDPGEGRLRFDYGRQTVMGMLELTPAPVLHVTKGTGQIPQGHTLMLAGPGKNGVVKRGQELEGKLVQASGILIERGDLDMLQINRLQAAKDQSNIPPIPAAEPLGRWKVTGEICDGKCNAGAMRPAHGIAHRACASLCILGGLPAVFVTPEPLAGEEFLLIAGQGDDTLPEGLFDYVGLYVSLEGDVSRHGDLLVLNVDTDTVELVQ